MRIVLAIDGSSCSDRARDLVATLPLPAGSQIRVVAVDEHLPEGAEGIRAAVEAGPHTGSQAETGAQRSHRHLRDALARAEAALESPGVRIETLLVAGRAATSIVDEAIAFSADLVVMGSRGRGRIQTMLLGSVAAEVVDHAPCPVLVARGHALGRVALAHDGSPTARYGETLLESWPVFAGRPIDVVTVSDPGVPLAVGLVPGVDGTVFESYNRATELAQEEHRALARDAAARLREAGHDAGATFLEGDPAAELVRFAEDRGVGTLVVGTRGLTGVSRMVLGSVSRNVLLHAPCSVLVVREPVRWGRERSAAEPLTAHQ